MVFTNILCKIEYMTKDSEELHIVTIKIEKPTILHTWVQ